MLADLRDHIAVTLMGWCARLATKQYQNELANYIQIGMARELAQIEMPSYCEAGLAGEWVSIN
jgi:hypothetical protein